MTCVRSVVSALEVILARELQRRLDRFRSAARVPDAIERSRRHFRDHRGQFFGGIAGEESRVDIFKARGLLRHRRDDFGMAVAEARHGRPAARVDIAPALLVDQVNSFSADGDRRPRLGRSVKDVLGPHRVGAWSSRLFPVKPPLFVFREPLDRHDGVRVGRIAALT